MNLILSCEHGDKHIPDDYQYLFKGAEEILNSHRGYDIGAKELFEAFNFQKVKYAQLNSVSRLLVDVNRSLYRRTLFSEYTKGLDKTQKKEILSNYYFRYRQPFEQCIYKLWERGESVLHLSIHSFTPILNGAIRQTDIGLLYHPQRPGEKEFCREWKQAINYYRPDVRVRFNYPYSGRPDGHVRYFRDREEVKYMGVELEMNQKYANNSEFIEGVVKAFRKVYNEFKENKS